MFDLFRGLACSAYVGFSSVISNGFLRSAICRQSVNRKGEPQPWFTLPAIDWLNTLALNGSRVLEFGCGNSSVFWVGKGCTVVGFDDQASWANQVRNSLGSKAEIFEVPKNFPEQLAVIGDRLRSYPKSGFDIVVIDGLARSGLWGIANDYVADSGIIIVDNSESFDMHKDFAIQTFASDFLRVDFIGHALGVRKRHVTSIYFRVSTSFFSSLSAIESPCE